MWTIRYIFVAVLLTAISVGAQEILFDQMVEADRLAVEVFGIERLDIHCAPDNARSAALAGITRASTWPSGRARSAEPGRRSRPPAMRSMSSAESSPSMTNTRT